MSKPLFFFFLTVCCITDAFSQVLYNESFNTQTLNTATYTANNTTQTYLYNNVPAAMFTINNGNLTADTLTGNYPFRANGQKQKAWLTYMPAAASNITDTFAVSTSWLTPAGTADAWLITPTINNIASNSVLTWEAMAPDVNNPDSYEIYVTTNTSSSPVTSDFSGAVFTISQEKNTWQKHGISLAAYSGQNIRIAFRNVSGDKYQLWIDDIKVENVSTAFDVEAVSQNVYRYSGLNTNNVIKGIFKNNGHTPITNLTINYKMDNGGIVSEIKILSPSLNYLESRELSFALPYVASSASYNTFKIWSSTINGQADQNNLNDTVTGAITISSTIPAKKVLLEEYTGAWCDWCPDGYTALNTIATTNTNVIIAAIHDGDRMKTNAGDVLVSDFATVFPSATIDHYAFSGNAGIALERANWSTFITQRSDMIVPASVSVTAVNYNSTTHQIDATVSATFVGDVKGDYRLNLYVKENNVYGPLTDNSDNGWNQYNGLYSVPSSPYYQLGNLVGSNYLMTGADYKHQFVIDSILDGPYGVAGIIPVNASTNGQTYSKTYSFTLPAITPGEFRFNADNIYLIGVVSEYDADVKNRSILNAAEVKLTTNPEAVVGVKELTNDDFKLNIYPNPTTDVCHLNYTLTEDQYVKVSVYNTLGELVYMETKNANAGNVNHTLNITHLQSGNYSIQVSFKNNSISKKITIIK